MIVVVVVVVVVMISMIIHIFEIVIGGDGNVSSWQSLGFKRKPDMTSGRELFDTHHFSNINVHSKYPHDLSQKERPHSFPLAKLVLCSRRPVQ